MKIKFVEKTLGDIANFFKWGFFAEYYSRKNGFLQQIDPGIKIIFLILSLIIINFTSSIPVLLGYYTVILALVYLSKVNMDFFIRKILVILPVVGIIILFPATLNIFIKGEVLIPFTENIYVTKEGTVTMFTVITRSLDSIALIILVNLTTSWHKIINALEIFKVPKLFIIIMNVSYRYLFLLIKTIEEMQLSLKSRLIRKPDRKTSYEIIKSQISTIFEKSTGMTEQVYRAMVSRGYRIIN